MVSINSALRAIKCEPHKLLNRERILELCRTADYWPEADGKLDPPTLIGLFMRQIAAGNVSCDCVRLMGQDGFSASGYCQARQRLPLEVIRNLAREVYQKLSEPLDRQDRHRWKGHRVLLMDASSYSMPDTPELQQHFGQPTAQKAGCGFPVAHPLFVFNARTGLAVDALNAPWKTHEMSLAAGTHERLSPGDLVAGDDSFGTYAHLALLSQRGLHGLFPAHHLRIVDFTPGRPCIEPQKVAKAKDAKGLPRSRWIKSVGENDQVVEWFKPVQKPKWMSSAQWKKLPSSLCVRETRRTIARPGFRPVTLTNVTTLLDPKVYAAHELFDLRLGRWTVEVDLRHLKSTLKMDVLHCKSKEAVEKELWMFLLIYNLVRAVMVSAAKRQKVSVDRISFASALHWMQCASDGDPLLRLAIVPHRPNRMEPRVLKRRAKGYDLMVRPRKKMREELRAVIGARPSG
jgi:hypothetical protein